MAARGKRSRRSTKTNEHCRPKTSDRIETDSETASLDSNSNFKLNTDECKPEWLPATDVAKQEDRQDDDGMEDSHRLVS
ncbi:hypothetical protein LSH36_84g05033 [Paralvinella palmiformis]|uniref:Uncharacterized protein n=1 Tax=Paralvinella palmiformis TaxID=53620 RepID=A0AAD9K333_9ANNE|nr:hypothetical protein LSH36_84g05033 [Paralvinella palmiformis]